jgi:hypothetical protein
MPPARKVALRVNGRHVTKATLRRKEKELELVIADPLIGEFVIDESFTVELLELVHSHGYCSFAHSALASFRMGMSELASFQRAKRSPSGMLSSHASARVGLSFSPCPSG